MKKFSFRQTDTSSAKSERGYAIVPPPAQKGSLRKSGKAVSSPAIPKATRKKQNRGHSRDLGPNDHVSQSDDQLGSDHVADDRFMTPSDPRGGALAAPPPSSDVLSDRFARARNVFSPAFRKSVRVEVDDQGRIRKASNKNLDGVPRILPGFHDQGARQNLEEVGLKEPKARTTFSEMIQSQLPPDVAGSDVVNNTIKMLEDLIIFLALISDVTTTRGMSAAITSYYKTFIKGSVLVQASDFVLGAFMTEQNATSGIELKDTPFLIAMKSIRSNWGALVNGSFCENVSKLLGVSVVLGLSKLTDVTFTLGKYQVFAPNMLEITRNAGDLIQAILDLSIFFFERIYKSWAAGSVIPLLFDDDKSQNMDEELIKLKAFWPSIKVGDPSCGVTKQEFDKRLTELCKEFREFTRTQEGMNKTIAIRRYEEVVTLLTNSHALDMQKSERMCPISIGLFGDSGVGKTTLISQLITKMGKALGFPTKGDHVYIVKPNQDHWDKFQNHTTVLWLDDYGNGIKPEVDENVLIKAVNRSAFQPHMADLEGKARSDCRPRMVMISGHDKTCRAKETSICPHSVQRRVHIPITVRVKDEFKIKSKDGMGISVDYEKVNRHYSHPDGTPRSRFIDDIWIFDVEKLDESRGMGLVSTYSPEVFNGKELTGIGIKELLAYLIYRSQLHFANEARQLELNRLHAEESSDEDETLCGRLLDTPFGPMECSAFRCVCNIDHDAIEERLRVESDDPDTNGDDEADSPFDDTMLHSTPTPVISPRPPETARGKYRHGPGPTSSMKNQSIFDSTLAWREGMANAVVKRLVSKQIAKDANKRYILSTSGAATSAWIMAGKFWESTDWVKFIPSWCLQSPMVQQLMLDTDEGVSAQVLWRHALNRFRMFLLKSCGVGTIIPLLLRLAGCQRSGILKIGIPAAIGSISIIAGTEVVSVAGAAVRMRHSSVEELLKRNDVTSMMHQSTRDRAVTGVIALGGAVGTAYAVLKLFRALCDVREIGFEAYMDSLFGIEPREVPTGTIGSVVPDLGPVTGKDMVEHMEFQPFSPEQLEVRTQSDTPWKKMKVEPLTISERAKTMTNSQCEDVVVGNLKCLKFLHHSTGEYLDTVNLLMIGPNIGVMPKHYFKAERGKRFSVQAIHNDDPDSTNHSYRFEIFPDYVVENSHSDMAFVFVSRGSGVTARSIEHLLMDDYIPGDQTKNFTMIYRNKLGSIDRATGIGCSRLASISGSPAYWGLNYVNFTGVCMPGLCGAPLIGTGSGACVYGMHTAGHNNEPTGFAAQILRRDYEEATRVFASRGLEQLRTRPILAPATMGAKLLDFHPVSNKHPLRWMNGSCGLLPVAGIPGDAIMKSNVKDLPIREDMEETFPIAEKYRPPKITPGWFGTRKYLEDASDPLKEIDPALLESAVIDFISGIDERLDHFSASPLPVDVVVNGVDGDRFMKGIDTSTSIGPPLSGTKEPFIIRQEDGKKRLIPEVFKEYLESDQKLRSGQPIGSYAKMFNKDEKVTSDKVRKIFANHFPTNLLIRRYFLSLVRVVQCSPIEFECAVGINPLSREWDACHSYFTKFGESRMFAGDYKGWDKKVSPQLLRAGFKIFYHMAERFGYSETDIEAMKCLESDLIHPYIDIDGVITLSTMGGWISGNPLTVIVNSFCNALLKRCFFKTVYPEPLFRNRVAMLVYGDDDIGSVSSKCPNYNCKDFAAWLRQHGMEFTSPQKGTVTVNYYNIGETDFLKRRSSFNNWLGYRVGVLDWEVIYAMGIVYVKNKGNGLSAVDHTALNMRSMLYEAAYHGEKLFAPFSQKLKKIADKHEITGFVDPIYWDWASIMRRHEPRLIETRLEPKRLQAHEIPFADSELEIIDQLLYDEQSEQQGVDSQENVMFMDANGQMDEAIPSFIDEVREANDNHTVDLQGILARPVRIHTFEWKSSIPVRSGFDPWQLFLLHPKVCNRLTNFNLLRGDLVLKFVINGTPFHYGRLMAAYLPLYGYDNVSPRDKNFPNQELINVSQRPKIFLNPTCSQGGVMRIPFFHFRDSLHIPSVNGDQLGWIDLAELNTLKQVNTESASSVTINVYAHMENAKFSVLSSLDMQGMTEQSERQDEVDRANTQGIVSKAASSLARVARGVKSIPQMRPYATAVEYAATMSAEIASAFGYSRPIVTRAPDRIIPTAMSSLANGNTPDHSEKLTIDVNQALSIDRRIGGVDQGDTMSVKFLAGRESYLATFDWNVSSTTDDLLWNARVHPMFYASFGFKAYYMTPLCAAALPFEFWSGTIIFRFMVVASAYHRGRLRFVYDPNYIQSLDENVTHSAIVDISEQSDFSFSVGMAQPTAVLPTLPLAHGGSNNHYNITALTSDGNWSNGVIGVYVVNELSTPDITNGGTVQINVFVKAGEDFQVYNPTDEIASYDYIFQSERDGNAINSMCWQDEPVPTALFEGSPPSDKQNLVYFGERVDSLLLLCKRFVKHGLIALSIGEEPQVLVCIRRWMPYLRGLDPKGVHTSSTGNKLNYCNTLMMHYVAMMHVGVRGSIRYKMMVVGHSTHPQHLVMSAEKVPTRISYQDNYRFVMPVRDSVDVAAYHSCQANPNDGEPISSALGMSGMAMTMGSINPVLQFEMPYTSMFRFTPTRTDKLTDDNAFEDGFSFKAYVSEASGAFVECYSAVGEDFQCYFFIGVPRMQNGNIPVPPPN